MHTIQYGGYTHGDRNCFSGDSYSYEGHLVFDWDSFGSNTHTPLICAKTASTISRAYERINFHTLLCLLCPGRTL